MIQGSARPQPPAPDAEQAPGNDLLDALALIGSENRWPEALVPELGRLLREGEDAELFRINPVRFGRDRGFADVVAIDLFLYAAQLGLVEMEWDLFCPICGDIVRRFSALRSVDAHCYCNLCQLDFEARLDDLIEVCFTVSPTVRRLRFHDPAGLCIDEYFFTYSINRGLYEAGGMRWVDWLRAHALKAMCYLEPGERRQFDVDLGPGTAEGCDRLNLLGFKLDFRGKSVAERRTLRCTFTRDGIIPPVPDALAPGPLRVDVENVTGRRAAFIFFHVGGPFSTSHEPFLSGKRILTCNAFRVLHATDAPAAETGLAIKDLTILFTDLKGSTALYDRIGDLNAFLLVSRHFQQLQAIVAAHGGAVVKTIGDAVMAVFDHPAAGVRAALEMLAPPADAHDRERLLLKIGLHRGPTLAVRLNDIADYFGQTVNLASRAQQQAGAGELCLTAQVRASAGVDELVNGLPQVIERAGLDGVSEVMDLYRIRGSERQ